LGIEALLLKQGSGLQVACHQSLADYFVFIGQDHTTKRFGSAKRQPEAATRSGNEKRQREAATRNGNQKWQKAEVKKIFMAERIE
jgi:hypothetical protein